MEQKHFMQKFPINWHYSCHIKCEKHKALYKRKLKVNSWH